MFGFSFNSIEVHNIIGAEQNLFYFIFFLFPLSILCGITALLPSLFISDRNLDNKSSGKIFFYKDVSLVKDFDFVCYSLFIKCDVN